MAYVFRAFRSCSRCKHTAARAGSDNGGAGRLADAPRGLEVREDVPQENTQRPYCEAKRQTAHRRGFFFGDFVVEFYIEASSRPYGAEPTGPQQPPLQPRPGHASAKKPRGKAVRGGKYPQTRTLVGIFMSNECVIIP